MLKYQKLISFLLSFWAGMVTAISFLEAWLKFRAEGVTIAIGLSIGKLVFTSLNRIEFVFLCIIWLLSVIFYRKSISKVSSLNFLLWLITAIVFIQTFWFLPELSERAEIIIKGGQPNNSGTHIFYIVFEFTKLISLIILSFKYRINEAIAKKL